MIFRLPIRQMSGMKVLSKPGVAGIDFGQLTMRNFGEANDVITGVMLDEWNTFKDADNSDIAGLKRHLSDSLKNSLEFCLSFVSTAGYSGKMVAVQTNHVITKTTPFPTKVDIDALPYSDKVKWVIHFLADCERTVYDLLPPEAGRLFKLDMVSVAKEYQRKGIGQALIDLSLERAHAKTSFGHEFSHMVTTATTLKTQNLYIDKFGFDILKAFPLKSYEINGVKPFSDMDETVNPDAKLLIKKI